MTALLARILKQAEMNAAAEHGWVLSSPSYPPSLPPLNSLCYLTQHSSICVARSADLNFRVPGWHTYCRSHVPQCFSFHSFCRTPECLSGTASFSGAQGLDQTMHQASSISHLVLFETNYQNLAVFKDNLLLRCYIRKSGLKLLL